MAEHLHRHHPIQHHPAAKKRQHRADRDVGAQHIAIAGELVAKAGVDVLVLGHGKRDRVP